MMRPETKGSSGIFAAVKLSSTASHFVSVIVTGGARGEDAGRAEA
jgi:hypothetical protein